MCHLGGVFLLQSRRGFLIGAGSLLTAAFVTEAQAFVRQAAKPLLAEQAEAQLLVFAERLERTVALSRRLAIHRPAAANLA